ncbi:tRNA lysidine(34) synthetase TilS [Shewanella donghaensis]|uniref:tRNA lysidine(34) synthetase TilS n=1 Tax=Shewanella donghaensis TaxID=238836 RepID=UPI001D044D11|nr:tRNA lysidine(34) synthetase TilS [Shewanella donghaensis]
MNDKISIDIGKAIEAQTLPLINALPQAKLVLAYSGGVDSECLAYGLSQFSQQYPHISCLLVHVHHGLSDNADVWANHCISQAQKYQLPIQVERVRLQKAPRQSLEAVARDARYGVFKKYLNKGDVLLTAHHQDDQLETLLLALKRGQGPKGLASMGVIQAFNLHSWIVRPLLDFTRQDIEAFAQQKQLCHIEDESNKDVQFDRNFLRLEIIPLLKKRWPSITATASRSAKLCAEQQEVIEHEVGNRLPLWLDTSTRFELPAFKLVELSSQTAQWQALLFRGYTHYLGFNAPSQSQLEQVLHQLINAADDAKVDVNCGDYAIKRFNGKAFLVPQINKHEVLNLLSADDSGDDNLATQIELLFTGDTQQLDVALGNTRYLLKIAKEGIRLKLASSANVTIAYGAKGSIRCQPHFRDKGRELKKLWQELSVPYWQRSKIPLVFYNDTLVAAVGFWVDKRFLAEENELGIYLLA